jgi:hypothetical protein
MDANRKAIRISILICLLFFARDGLSQQIKILCANRQEWARGVCCQRGFNYYIDLEITQLKHPMVLDSIWFDGYGRSMLKYNPEKKNKKDTLFISIVEAFSFDDGFPMDFPWSYDPTKKGVVLGYLRNRKKLFLDITPFIKVLEFLEYP